MRAPARVLVSAAVFRQEASTLLLVRLTPVRVTPVVTSTKGKDLSRADSRTNDFMQASTDGFVFADAGGRIISANPTFVEMAQLASEDNARNEPLDRWFGRSSVDLDVMMANLRQHGSVRLFSTSLRGDQGANLDVEVSGVTLGQGKAATYGFHDPRRRTPACGTVPSGPRPPPFR